MTKQKPDLVLDRLGTHLFKVTRKDGTSFLKWDWDKLLQEVRDATLKYEVTNVAKDVVTDLNDAIVVAKDLIKETEAKVKRTRKKKEV